MITVRFSYLFREAVGQGEITLEGFRGGVNSLIDYLVRNYPGLGAQFLTPTGELESHILVAINDQIISGPQDMETQLKDGDCVCFFPVFAGG